MAWLPLILASAILLGFYTPMLKHALQHEKNTQIIALYPLIAAAVLALTVPIDYGIILTQTGLFLLLKSFTLGLSLFSATLALTVLPVSIYAPLRNLNPIFLLFFGWLLLGESIDRVQILGLLLIITGAILLDINIREKHQLRRIRNFFKQPAILLLILTAISISFCPIFDRIILKRTDPFTALFWYLLPMAALFWAVHIIKERRLPVQGVESKEWLWITAMALIILASDWLYFLAVQLPGTVMVVLIGTRRMSNLLSTLLGGRLFHEKQIIYKGAMCLLMILGTVLLAL